MMLRALDPTHAPDRQHWLRMRQALFPDCSDAMHAFEMERHLDGGFAVILAEAEDATVGFIEVSVRTRVEHSTEEHVGYVEAWYVKPEWHGRGAGRALMHAAEEWVRGRGLRELASDTDLGNTDGLAAHKALGFYETERIITLLKRLD